MRQVLLLIALTTLAYASAFANEDAHLSIALVNRVECQFKGDAASVWNLRITNAEEGTRLILRMESQQGRDSGKKVPLKIGQNGIAYNDKGEEYRFSIAQMYWGESVGLVVYSAETDEPLAQLDVTPFPIEGRSPSGRVVTVTPMEETCKHFTFTLQGFNKEDILIMESLSAHERMSSFINPKVPARLGLSPGVVGVPESTATLRISDRTEGVTVKWKWGPHAKVPVKYAEWAEAQKTAAERSQQPV